MQTYVMFGTYNAEAVKGVSGVRTKKAAEIVKKCGGEMKSILALLGKPDLLIVAEFPDNRSAVKASLGLARSTGIAFRTAAALGVEEFDKLAGEA